MSDYAKEWDQQYFNDFFLRKTGNLWDVEAEHAVMIDKKLFENKMDFNLPILDLGCGTGKQSLALSKWFPKVIGVDVSKRAIQIAKANNSAENINYLVKDLSESDGSKEILNHLGHCNIYMRGVFHQIRAEHRLAFISSVKQILGLKGTLFFNEVRDDIRDYFHQSESGFKDLPERMRQVFLTKLPPKGVNINMLRQEWEGDSYHFDLLKESNLNTSLTFRSGNAIKIPSIVGIFNSFN